METAHDASTIQTELARIEGQVTNLIGDQFIPPYPLFLLVVLQQLELARRDSVLSGSIGYLYEALVLRQLADSTTRDADIDTNKNYLTELAYRLFLREQDYLSTTDAAIWHGDHCAKYKLPIDFGRQKQALVSAGLLSEQYGTIRFKYPYLYYYFVAQYWRPHIH